MEKICEERHLGLDKQIDTIIIRLNDHSKRLDITEKKMVAQEKDTTHLQDAIKALKLSIDLLIIEIGGLKAKPLEKYEKIGMLVITAIVAYAMGKIL